MIALSGVRSSWLIAARKAVFDASAERASSRAAASSSSWRLLSVISWQEPWRYAVSSPSAETSARKYMARISPLAATTRWSRSIFLPTSAWRSARMTDLRSELGTRRSNARTGSARARSPSPNMRHSSAEHSTSLLCGSQRKLPTPAMRCASARRRWLTTKLRSVSCARSK